MTSFPLALKWFFLMPLDQRPLGCFFLNAIGPKASWLLPVKFSGFSEIKFVLSFPLALEIYVTFFSLILLNKFHRSVGLRRFVPSFPSPFLCIGNHKEILLTPLIMREVLGLDTELE